MGYDPTGHWNWGWKARANFGVTLLIVGLAILLAAPTGGSSLAVGGLMLSSATVLAAGGSMAVVGTVIVGDAMSQANIDYAKASKKAIKKKQTITPAGCPKVMWI